MSILGPRRAGQFQPWPWREDEEAMIGRFPADPRSAGGACIAGAAAAVQQTIVRAVPAPGSAQLCAKSRTDAVALGPRMPIA